VRADDVALRERLKALAQERRRFGYRRLHVLLRREGHAVNKKRVQRLYREERLTVRRRGGRKRALGTRRPMVTPQAPDQRWSQVRRVTIDSQTFTEWRRRRSKIAGPRTASATGLADRRGRLPWHRRVADHVVAPRGDKLRVPKWDRAIFFVDDCGEHVIGFAVSHNRRVGFRLDVNFVELPLSAATKRG
jgi:transposase InsO family protein